MADLVYNRFLANLANKEVDMDADTIKCALMATGHSASTVDDDVWADVSGNEASGTGYSANGKDLTTTTVTQDDTNDLMKFDADDVSWTTATITAYYAVLYDDTMTNNDLICSFDFGGAKTASGGTFTISWNASGILTLAQA
jgi:hypothetical protein